MSDQTPLEKTKYSLLKIIDVSGFKVFDPVIRLLFGEEPGKQVGEITRYMITPIIFVCCCMLLWNFVAPRHKTKSGEVPAPKQVWGALITNDTIHNRENEKESDFALSDSNRENTIEEVTALLTEKEKASVELKAELVEVEAECKKEKQDALAPLKEELAQLKAENKKLRESRAVESSKIADSVAAKEADPESLLEYLRNDSQLKTAEKDSEKELKDKIKAIEDEDSKRLKFARLESSKVANEVQHLKKRLDYLSTGNRSEKVTAAEGQRSRFLWELCVVSTGLRWLV